MDPVEAALAYVDGRFPGCPAALLAGSVVRGEATSTSDLDIVVITTSEEAPFRESVRQNGWPIEAFIHTEESLTRYFAMDAERRRPSLPAMCLEGIVLCDRRGLAGRIKEKARRLLERGPQPLTPEEIERYRYGLTDLLDDLIGGENEDERLFIASLLAQNAADFILAHNRQWTGTGKWTLRALSRFDPALARQLTAALHDCCRTGSHVGLVQCIDEALAPAGGRLFEGYRAGEKPNAR